MNYLSRLTTLKTLCTETHTDLLVIFRNMSIARLGCRLTVANIKWRISGQPFCRLNISSFCNSKI